MTEPSPHDRRQAELLRELLDGGLHEPGALDAEVCEAVWALRPELARPPREGLLDDALAEVMEGPLAGALSDEELKAAAQLADRVDALAADGSIAGAVDPEDDALEAIFALRPELAPPPALSIDDILGAVETGPFAPVLTITGEFPAEIAPPTKQLDTSTAESPPPEAEVVSLAARREAAAKPAVAAPARASRWRWVGIAAVAASAILVVTPVLRKTANEAMPMPALAPVSADAVPDGAAAGSGRPRQGSPSTSAQQGPAPGKPRPKKAAPAKKPTSRAYEDRSREVAIPAAGERQTELSKGGELDVATDAGVPMGAAPSTGTRADPKPPEETAPEAEPVPAAAPVPAELDTALSTNTAAPEITNTADLDTLGYVAAGSGAAPRGDAFEQEGLGRGGLDDADFEDAELEEVSSEQAYALDEVRLQDIATTSKRKSRREAARSRRDESPAAASPPPPPPAAYDASPSDDDAVSLGLLDPSLADRYPSYKDTWAQIAQWSAAGDPSAAVALERLADSAPEHDVVADAALRAARMWVQRGDPDRADRLLPKMRALAPQSPVLQRALAAWIEARSPPDGGEAAPHR